MSTLPNLTSAKREQKHTSHIHQKHKRDTTLRAKLDEMCRLQGRRREQNPIIRDDADWVAVYRGEARYDRGPILALELAEARAIDDARDDIAHVEGLAHVGADDTV